MGRRTKMFLMTAVAAVAALVPAAGASAGTLDQQQTISSECVTVAPGNSYGQTFTAGLTGQLDQVDLALSSLSLTAPLTVQIQDGSPTGPGGTVLATASVPTSAGPGPEAFVPITFSSPASVTAGTQYSIVAFTDNIGWTWCSGEVPVTSPYAGGKLYSGPADTGPGSGPWFEGDALDDFEFKTYVASPTTTPPPGGGDPPATTPKKKKCKKKKGKTSASAAAKKKKCKKKKK
jgi:hypothetical protein